MGKKGLVREIGREGEKWERQGNEEGGLCVGERQRKGAERENRRECKEEGGREIGEERWWWGRRGEMEG